MTSMTPLLDRINARKPQPVQITERMSPFAKRLAEKRLPTKALYNGAWVPQNSDGAA